MEKKSVHKSHQDSVGFSPVGGLRQNDRMGGEYR